MAADGNCSDWTLSVKHFLALEEEKKGSMSLGDTDARTSGLKLEFAAHKELHMYKQTLDKQPENHEKTVEV